MMRLAALILLAWSAVAVAQETPDLVVEEAHILEVAPSARAAAGYFRLRNTGDRPYTLTGIEAGFPRAMLHETVEGEGGVMRMEPVETVEIDPGESVLFEQGGRHAMFMGLDRQLTAGEEVPATLIFEDDVRLPLTFDVVGPEGH